MVQVGASEGAFEGLLEPFSEPTTTGIGIYRTEEVFFFLPMFGEGGQKQVSALQTAPSAWKLGSSSSLAIPGEPP
ncbi:unnamed protein product [Caenorhabditis auriculariae]|uniref:Uncharacterized protein n=1 Tax=Caenorhabditis auriculariae TaxID=2777116 RepID=A0A8S1HUW0_9PELO|nr:unnamed protein product [Caenorhabditis auriculariae]